MSLEARLLLFGLMALVAIVLLPFLRSGLAHLFGPVVMEALKGSLFTLTWIIKTLVRDHLLVMRSLVTPRRILFPSLSETLREEENEARGRTR